MKLIDKDALVAEINQRVKDYKSHKIDDSYHDGLIFALEDLRDDFINTLEVKEAEEEPVSEDLEEVAHNYAEGENPTCPCEECLIKTFKAGAKWQKEQDQSIIELAEDHAMLAGMEKMKEQMMKDAIDSEIFDIFYPDGDCLEIHAKIPEDKFQDGDKVKIIIIKKE